MTLDEAILKAEADSTKGYVQHVNKYEIADSWSCSETIYVLSDWYDAELTVKSFENGREL